MRKNLNYSSVITIWLDEDDGNNLFEPEPGAAYCIHYDDSDGNEQTVNLFFDLISKTPGVDCCEICPFSRNKKPGDDPPCNCMVCDGLAPMEFDFAADNTTLIFKTSGEPIFIDSEELEEGVREDAARRRRELSFKLAGCLSSEEIEKEYKRWVDSTPGYLRDVLELDEIASETVEARKRELELGASKKTVRKRTKNGRKTDDATSTVKERPEKEIASKENKTKNGKRTKNGRKSDEPFAPTQALVVPATDPPPVVYAPVDKSEERRKQWEDALLELDKEARRLEFKESLAKEEAKDARNAARAIRQQIKNMLEGGSKNYVEKTPLFNGLDDEDDAMDADDLKEFEKSLDKDMER